MAARVVVVTGSNKGIGFETVKQICQKNPTWIVYVTARDKGRGEKAVNDLKSLGLNPRFHVLDVDSLESIQTFADFLKKEHGGLDVLVNNAAIYSNAPKPTTATNYFGLINVCNAFFPLLRDHARVVNVSSRDGHSTYRGLSGPLKEAFKNCKTVEDVDTLITNFVKLAQERKLEEAGWVNAAYGVSKVGVTVASYVQQRLFDADTTRKDVIVNACCPGYVKTDMNDGYGLVDVQRGADTPAYLAMLPENCTKPRGTFVNERKINDIYTDCDCYYPS